MKVRFLLPVLLFLVSNVNGQFWLRDFDGACKQAQNQNKLILIDFYADWCGPCKDMDVETWSQEEVKKEMGRIIPARINIDFDKTTALKYSIKAIPTIILVDAWGNVLYSKTGFQEADDIQQLLSSLPENTENFYANMKSLQDDPKDGDLNMQTGICCQKMAKTLDGEGKDLFLRNSFVYLNNAKKGYKKAKNELMTERVDLLKCYNDLILGRTNSSVKSLEKMNLKNVQTENKSLAFYIAAQAYASNGDDKSAKDAYQSLAALAGNAEYLEELQTLNPELFQ